MCVKENNESDEERMASIPNKMDTASRIGAKYFSIIFRICYNDSLIRGSNSGRNQKLMEGIDS